MKQWGKRAQSGVYFGGWSAFFFVPGIGPVLVAGSAVAWIVAALESGLIVGGLQQFVDVNHDMVNNSGSVTGPISQSNAQSA